VGRVPTGLNAVGERDGVDVIGLPARLVVDLLAEAGAPYRFGA
jgi:hypothetical protein